MPATMAAATEKEVAADLPKAVPVQGMLASAAAHNMQVAMEVEMLQAAKALVAVQAVQAAGVVMTEVWVVDARLVAKTAVEEATSAVAVVLRVSARKVASAAVAVVVAVAAAAMVMAEAEEEWEAGRVTQLQRVVAVAMLHLVAD